MAGFPLVIVILTLLIYLNTLANGFTFDDFHKVLENPVVTSPDWTDPLGFFIPDARHTQHPERAVPQLVFSLQYALWGDNAIGYHLVNVLLHAGVSLFLFLVCRSLFPEKIRLSFLVSVLFACHPIHVDVVASVIGLGELISSICCLLALWLYITSTRSESAGWSRRYWLTLPVLLIGALSKETASWALPFMVAGVDIFRFAIPQKMPLRRYIPLIGRRFLKFYMPWLAVLIGVGMISLAVTSPPEVAANYLILLPWGERMLAVIGIFMRYLFLLVWPFRLSCDYSYSQLSYQSRILQSLWIAGGVAAIATGCALAWLSLKKRGGYFLALFVFAVNYGIISNILLLINVSMAERLVYAASMGFCLASGLVFDGLLCSHYVRNATGKGRRNLVWGLIALVVFAWSVRTWTRNRDWKDNFTLFSSSVKSCPMSCRLNYNLGIEYMNMNRIDRAIFHYRRAVASIPWNAQYHVNLGEAYVKAGELDLAIAEFEEATRLMPMEPAGFINLGGALMDKGDFSKSYACLSIACKLGPDDWQAFFNMGNLCVSQGYLDRAVTVYQQSLKLNPDNWNVWNRLGTVHLKTGHPQQAAKAFACAVRLYPNYKEAHNNLGLAYVRLGNKQLAVQSFRKALAIDPEFALARSNLQRLMMGAQ